MGKIVSLDLGCILCVDFATGCILSTIAFVTAKEFPDLDLKLEKLGPGCLHHRSSITHSMWVVVIVYSFTSNIGNPIWFLTTMGAAIGTAYHLGHDLLFTRDWRYKRSRVHMARRPLPPFGSILWLLLNAVGGLALGVQTII